MGRLVVGKKDVKKKRTRHYARVRADIEESREIPSEIPSPELDSYMSRLFKYIPAEVVALYLVLSAVITSSGHPLSFWMQLFAFLFVVVGTPLYLWRIQKVWKVNQLLISTVSVILWIFAIGGFFTYFTWYDPLWGAIAVPVYTFIVALIEA